MFFLLYSRLPFELKPLLGSSDSNQPQVKSEAFYKKKVGEARSLANPSLLNCLNLLNTEHHSSKSKFLDVSPQKRPTFCCFMKRLVTPPEFWRRRFHLVAFHPNRKKTCPTWQVATQKVRTQVRFFWGRIFYRKIGSDLITPSYRSPSTTWTVHLLKCLLIFYGKCWMYTLW